MDNNKTTNDNIETIQIGDFKFEYIPVERKPISTDIPEESIKPLFESLDSVKKDSAKTQDK